MVSANNMQHIADQNIGNMSDVEVRWNKTHDFSALHNTCDDNVDINDIRLKCQETLTTSQVINRREACKLRLNVK